MRATIDTAGRVVIPKAIRDAVQIRPGATLSIRAVDGRVEIEPAPLRVRIEKRGHAFVAVPLESVAPMTQQAANDEVDALRREREAVISGEP